MKPHLAIEITSRAFDLTRPSPIIKTITKVSVIEIFLNKTFGCLWKHISSFDTIQVGVQCVDGDSNKKADSKQSGFVVLVTNWQTGNHWCYQHIHEKN